MGFTAAQQSASGGDGMTQNPSLAALSAAGVSVWLDDLSRNLLQSGKLQHLIDTAVRMAITDDVRAACDVLRPQWEASDGVDGRVSIEVDPSLAHNTDATVTQAVELAKIVDRPNVFIKIPATTAGLPAITAALAKGVSVNVTLIFSVQRHRAVMNAYLAGIEAAQNAGADLSQSIW